MNTRIKELRKLKKMSQEEFGKKIGLSQRAISEIEVGTNGVKESNFKMICHEFHVNPEWLRYGIGEMFVADRESMVQAIVDEFELTTESALLLKTFLELPEEHRQGVLAFATTFARAMAAQMGIEFPQREEMPVRPTAEQKRAIMNRELDAEAAAEKRGIITSSAFTTTSGSRKNLVTALESQKVIL